MTGLRKSGRGSVPASHGDPQPARLIEPCQMHEIIDDRMTPCHKAVSIAKNRPYH